MSVTREEASGTHCWRYDEESDVLIDNGVSVSGMAANIRSQIESYGFASGSAYTLHSTISKNDIIGKFVPD